MKMENNKKQLNSSQARATNHLKGPLLIIAGAGTGKTTVITERIKNLISQKKIKPDNILALTFTQKAAREMLDRLDVVMPLGYEEPWIMTFHAFCERILQEEGLEIGLSTDYKILDTPSQWILVKKHLFELGLHYYLPLGNPTRFIVALLKFFSRAQDEDILPQDLKKNIDKDERLEELAQAYKKYQEIKLKENFLDFGDLVLWTLTLFRKRSNILAKYRRQFNHILVDEFQDTNWAQLQLVKLLAPPKNNPNLVVVGDDDQCLLGDSLIALPKGQKKIKEIVKGDCVLTAVGKGHIGFSKVTKVMKNIKYTRFLTFTTESGKKIKVTDNHKMFCYVPRKVDKKNYYYVYLMSRENLGWRLGVTNDLAVRLKLERSADKIIGLRAFKTEQDAIYYETLWSLKYQIPTVCFKKRDGIVIKEELLEKLYKFFDTQTAAKRLAKDLGVDLNSYHYCLDGVTRGLSKRVKINFYLCFRNYVSKENKYKKFLKNPGILHSVHLETSNTEIIKKINKAKISYTKAKKGIRIRYSSADLEKAWEFAQKLQKITGAIIENKFILGKINYQNLPALVMPAGNILCGHYLPVRKDFQIVYEKVKDIEEIYKKTTVYDLEVSKTHNFIADDFVVHNSVYKWRGAAVSNILDFKKHYPKSQEVVLTQNYRSGQKLLDSAYRLIINNNPDRLEVKLGVDKKLTAERGIKLPLPQICQLQTLEEEADFVAAKILELSGKENYTFRDFAILARANNHLESFVAALKRNGIPYQLLGNRGLYDQDEVRDLIFFAKCCVDPTDSVVLFQTMNNPVFKINPDQMLQALAKARAVNKPLWEIIKEDEMFRLLINQVAKIREKITSEPASKILLDFINKTGYLKLFLPESLENQLKIKNISLFFEKIKRFEADNKNAKLVEFVSWLELLIQAGENPAQAQIEDVDTVVLSTVHGVKGLEFPVVFVVNCVADRFPTRSRSDPIEFPEEFVKETLPEGNSHLQEERRLFYVACTRARDYLFLTLGLNYGGVREKKPSIFLQELELSLEKINFKNKLFEVIPVVKPRKIISGKLKLDYISYSQIDTFLTCPLKYKYRYILQIPTKPHHALTYGTTIHDVLRDFHLLDLKGKKPDLKTLLQIFQKRFDETGYDSQIHKLERFNQGKQVLKNYFASHQESFQGKPVFLEKKFYLKFGSIPLFGRIDRIDKIEGKYELIDYKTGKVKTQKAADKDKQLTIYAMAAQWSLGIKPENLSLYFIDENQKFSTTRNEEILQKEKENIQKNIETILKSDFPAKPGFPVPCQYCDYNSLCPFAKKG